MRAGSDPRRRASAAAGLNIAGFNAGIALGSLVGAVASMGGVLLLAISQRMEARVSGRAAGAFVDLD